MPHYKTLIDTTFLGQWDLPPDRDAVVTIASVQRYRPAMEKKKKLPDGTWIQVPNKRIEIGFVGKKKHWLAGPVSHAILASMFGPDTDAWIGKSIALYVDPDVEMGKTRTGGLRCRPTPARGPATSDPLEREPTREQVEALERARKEAGQ
jgi:hypothetical protein